ncbi:MAG: hypothetical protein K1X64_18750 [Myxococcaceae bacterium]|nr:hypothetical protein [Myxococcaceae bacterium]
MQVTFRRPASLLPGSTGKRATTRQFLGQLAKPGEKLANQTFTLNAGDSLIFRVKGTPLRNINAFTASPGQGVQIAKQTIKPRLTEWTFKMPSSAKSGKEIKLTSVPTAQARTHPAWAFNFTITVP